MKKLIFGSILLMLVVFSTPSIAVVNVGVGISLPPIVIGGGSPGMVVLPGTDVYADPNIGADLFFYGGWWWRPWGGHWYRSHYYNSGWAPYSRVPAFYSRVPSNWRSEYSQLSSIHFCIE